MTLVTLNKPIAWPGLVGNVETVPGVGSVTSLDAAGEYTAYVFCAREAMTISDVAVGIHSATGSPTADVRIETVDSSGLPSGTLWATNTNIVTGTLSTGVEIHTLTASASISKGQVFCIKVAYNSGTNFALRQLANRRDVNAIGFPYRVDNTGTPGKSGTGMQHTACIAVGSSSTSFYQLDGCLPVTATANGNFNNTSGARRGIRFTAPFAGRLVGVRFLIGAVAGDFNITVYNDAGTELSSSNTAFDGDYYNQNCASTFYFDNAVTLAAGTTYRVVIEPTSATNSYLLTMTLHSSDMRGASPLGTIGHYTTYASSSWTDSDTTNLPIMDLLFDQLDDGAGASGGASFSAYAM